MEIETNTSVRIEEFKPDFEDLIALPMLQIYEIGQQEKEPGQQSGIWYLNPVRRVFSPLESNDFVLAVAKCQEAWFSLLSKQVGKGWRHVRKQERNRRARALEFDGVIFTGEEILTFEVWREKLKANTPEKEKLLSGSKSSRKRKRGKQKRSNSRAGR